MDKQVFKARVVSCLILMLHLNKEVKLVMKMWLEFKLIVTLIVKFCLGSYSIKIILKGDHNLPILLWICQGRNVSSIVSWPSFNIIIKCTIRVPCHELSQIGQYFCMSVKQNYSILTPPIPSFNALAFSKLILMSVKQNENFMREKQNKRISFIARASPPSYIQSNFRGTQSVYLSVCPSV